jgi:hypothetical protein
MDPGALFDPSFLLTSLSSVPTVFETGALALVVIVLYAIVQDCATLSRPKPGTTRSRAA